MKPRLLPALLILAAMIAAPVAAHLIRPTQKLADLGPKIDLETMIPMNFGDWRGAPSNNIVIADPQMQENLQRIYTQTVNRTYTDSRGNQIMLSIAYGEDQRDGMSLHYPEVCYPAQGFQMQSKAIGEVRTAFGTLRVKRLVMAHGSRHEPITYWAMTGSRPALSGTEKKLAEFRYALHDHIPDGLLFRVSSIGEDAEGAYRNQDRFVGDLLATLSVEVRKRLSGL